MANLAFGKAVTEIVPVAGAPVPFPVDPAKWPSFWKHGQWNELRARIVGNPPTITTWISGTRLKEVKETNKRHSDAGKIAVQVHGSGDFTRQFVRYRAMRVKRLAPAR